MDALVAFGPYILSLLSLLVSAYIAMRKSARESDLTDEQVKNLDAVRSHYISTHALEYASKIEERLTKTEHLVNELKDALDKEKDSGRKLRDEYERKIDELSERIRILESEYESAMIEGHAAMDLARKYYAIAVTIRDSLYKNGIELGIDFDDVPGFEEIDGERIRIHDSCGPLAE